MGWDEEFAEKASVGELVIGIVGLGYVGLPTAIGFFDAGFEVWGVDISTSVVESLNDGKNPIGDPSLDTMIPNSKSNRWNITHQFQDLTRHCDVIIVTVPTPVSEDLKPDLSYIRNAGKAIFESIPEGERKVIILESTVYPGVTASTWRPIIEEIGLVEGIDLDIAYCPERFNPGDSENGVRQVSRVIGCNDSKVGFSLVELYKKLTSGDVRYVGKLEIAEASKVIENVQRDINIALVNELAQIFPEIDLDVEEVLSAASTKWNFHRYTPGIGVGGHCIPVDPYYLIQRAQEVGVPTELITAARAVNRLMPNHVSSQLCKLMYGLDIPSNEGKVLLLGWSYKPGVGDARETPAEPLAKNLAGEGFDVSVWDPHIAKNDIPDFVTYIEDINIVQGYDIVVLVTAHEECKNIDWRRLYSSMNHSVIYDGRRVLDLEEMKNMGWITNAIGQPLNFGNKVR